MLLGLLSLLFALRRPTAALAADALQGVCSSPELCATAHPVRSRHLPTLGRTTEQGGVFGVRAEVVLDLSTRRASVELEGAPIGGRIAGTATLDPRGTVALDPDLSRALRRRFVSIVDVAADRSMRECAARGPAHIRRHEHHAHARRLVRRRRDAKAR